MKAKYIGWIIVIIIGIILFCGLFWVLKDSAENRNKYHKCIELYPLNSCELYKCRSEYSQTATNFMFNNRNYEICKIILENDMTFNESLGLLNTIHYEGT